MPELIEVQFGGGLTCMGPTNHVLDKGRYPSWELAILGVIEPIEKH